MNGSAIATLTRMRSPGAKPYTVFDAKFEELLADPEEP
jgi:hypothetical protein